MTSAGIRIADLLALAGPKAAAKAIRFRVARNRTRTRSPSEASSST